MKSVYKLRAVFKVGMSLGTFSQLINALICFVILLLQNSMSWHTKMTKDYSSIPTVSNVFNLFMAQAKLF